MFPTPFIDQMKQETLEAHDESKDSGFAVTIMSGQWSPLAFVEWQRALYPVYNTLETILKKNRKDPFLSIFDHRRLDRSERIFHDLSTYNVNPILDPSPLPCVQDYVNCVANTDGSTPRILAYHYTRYMGDMIGGQVIARSMKEKYGMSDESLTCYDFSEIGDLHYYRKNYKILIELLPWSEQEREDFVGEIKTAYQINAILFQELYDMLSVMHEKAVR
jgi:heme oxygenase